MLFRSILHLHVVAAEDVLDLFLPVSGDIRRIFHLTGKLLQDGSKFTELHDDGVPALQKSVFPRQIHRGPSQVPVQMQDIIILSPARLIEQPGHVLHVDFPFLFKCAEKNLTTAEGGALVWRDIDGVDNDTLYKKFMLLSLHGQSKDALAKTQLGAWEYDIVAPYFKCNMTDIMASLGLVQLKRYPGILERRKALIEKYNEGLKDLPITVLQHYGENFVSSGHLYLVRVDGKTRQECNDIIIKMAERGITTNVHYKPLPMLTAYKSLGFDKADYPNACDLFENAITLPLHTKLTDEEVDYVIQNFKECIE